MWGSTLSWHRSPRRHAGFWGQGQPPSSPRLPALASPHTQGRDTAEHPPSSQGTCRDFVHCQSRRWQIWHKGCQCLHSKVTKICLRECLPSFSRVFSGESIFQLGLGLSRSWRPQCLPFSGSATTSSSLSPRSCRTSTVTEYSKNSFHNTFYSSSFN